jgi:hypothetical protein
MSLFGGSFPMEYLMCAAVGFLAAWLLALMCLPAVHARAQRLLRQRYDELPLSVQEMRAEKDQIRAGFAAATRDLEVSIAKLKEKTTIHATEIAKKIQLIERLKQELEQQAEVLEQSIVRERQSREELHLTRQEFDCAHAALAHITDRERAARTELREARRELAVKDDALDAAEQEVAAIKSEITRIAPLLQLPASLMMSESLQAPHSAEIVPLAPGSAIAAQSRSHDDGVMRAWTEIDAAARQIEAPQVGARQVDARYEGNSPQKPMTNQTLRQAFAPAPKPVN